MKKPVRSRKLFERASRVLPGGVDSPVRAFQAVGGAPLFIARAAGSRLHDVDGNVFIDYVMSWGPAIHGHAPKGLVRALAAAARRGTSFGAPSPLEHELGERVRALMPSVERIRFVSSGTEATMSAVRVARAATRRDTIVKFEGCYHGHADGFLVKAGSGAMTLGVPTSPGVAKAVAADTLLAAYNDLRSVDALCEANPDRIAAVIVEPIAGNMGVVPPAHGFLQGLRDLCTRHGILLIFDEVITGFGRTGSAFAAQEFGVVPDMMTCAKGITNGAIPMGAVLVKREIYETFMSGPESAIELFHGYTFSAHPVACAAGLATQKLYRQGLFDRSREMAPYWCDAIHSLKGRRHVADLRAHGLVAGIELEARAGAPGARGYEALVRTFEAGLLVRTTGDTIAMSPPLIIERAQVDWIVETLGGIIDGLA